MKTIVAQGSRTAVWPETRDRRDYNNKSVPTIRNLVICDIMLTMMLVKNIISLLNTTIAPIRNMMNDDDNLPMMVIFANVQVF